MRASVQRGLNQQERQAAWDSPTFHPFSTLLRPFPTKELGHLFLSSPIHLYFTKYNILVGSNGSTTK